LLAMSSRSCFWTYLMIAITRPTRNRMTPPAARSSPNKTRESLPAGTFAGRNDSIPVCRSNKQPDYRQKWPGNNHSEED
jgi:hypothetical protein